MCVFVKIGAHKIHPLIELAVPGLFALRLQLAADGYRIVTFDHEVGLNAESFAISTFMYKQRFFSGCLPNLVQGFHAADPVVKANYVLALSHVLSAVPKQVLLSEVDAVWPLLVESLAQPEAGLSSSTLSLMRTLIEEAKDMMAGHAKSLIDALIPLCSYRVSPPRHVIGYLQMQVQSVRRLAVVQMLTLLLTLGFCFDHVDDACEDRCARVPPLNCIAPDSKGRGQPFLSLSTALHRSGLSATTMCKLVGVRWQSLLLSFAIYAF